MSDGREDTEKEKGSASIGIVVIFVSFGFISLINNRRRPKTTRARSLIVVLYLSESRRRFATIYTDQSMGQLGPRLL